VSGFDVSGDGNTIAYAAGGVVKRMAIDGDNVHVLTAAGAFDYAPEFTPDGTAIVVGRRDPTGADQGYWRIPIVSGVDPRQVSPDGAPGLGSVALHGDELTGSPGETSWAPRAAFSADGNAMLLVRGNDNAVELVDMTGVNPAAGAGAYGQFAADLGSARQTPSTSSPAPIGAPRGPASRSRPAAPQPE